MMFFVKILASCSFVFCNTFLKCISKYVETLFSCYASRFFNNLLVLEIVIFLDITEAPSVYIVFENFNTTFHFLTTSLLC